MQRNIDIQNIKSYQKFVFLKFKQGFTW